MTFLQESRVKSPMYNCLTCISYLLLNFPFFSTKKIIGTIAPLEHNTVRFVDNFSAGSRGSSSAEYFLQNNYAVIFLFRTKSLEPFTRHFSGQQFLDMLEISENSQAINVRPDSVDVLLPILTKYKTAQESNRLLYINFTSVSDYLWLLRAACESLAPFEKRALLFLAAAVSDFYVPQEDMPQHKIQSGATPKISLQLVPKILKPLTSTWVIIYSQQSIILQTK